MTATTHRNVRRTPPLEATVPTLSRRALLGGAGALALGAGTARAQDSWPSRPIAMVVSLQAGSASDLASRLVGEHLGRSLRQPVVVENAPGAGGVLGATKVFNAPPDGHLLGALNNGVVCLLPSLAKRPPQDFTTLEPVAMVADLPSVLVVAPSVPARTLAEFVAHSRQEPDRLFYGSVGVGSPQHVAMEMLKEATGARLTHVPFRGGPQAVTDVVSGQVHATWIAIPVAAGFIKAGQLRALAVGGQRRSALLPEVPTLKEAGVAGFTYVPWLGFYAPPRTPRTITARLNQAVREALQQPAVAQQLAANGLEGRPMELDAFARLAAAERQAMAGVIRRLALA